MHTAPPANGQKILVAEDGFLLAEVISDYLRDWGMEPIGPVSRLQEACRVARWIHEHRPDLKIILASGVFSTLDPADAQFHEGSLLQKPFKVDELMHRLRSVLGGAAPGP